MPWTAFSIAPTPTRVPLVFSLRPTGVHHPALFPGFPVYMVEQGQ
jgi:hypothetical protein